MVQFTFDGLFHTTNKGLPDTGNLDPFSYISVPFFVNSLITQIIFSLILLGFTAMSVYRSFYKIRNQNFFPQVTPQQNQDQQKDQNETQKSKSQMSAQNDQKSGADLIYRFDGEDNQKQPKQGEEKDKQKQQQQQQADDDEQCADPEITQWYLNLDHKLIFLQPFFIGFIIMNNIFIANAFLLVALCVMLVCYFIFNIKQYGKGQKIFKCLFMLPAIAVMFLVFVEDMDMRT